MQVLIVGGGATGLISAITLARKGISVTILERNNKCGKKLLITGNGRCNYWNENQSLDKYHSQNIELVQEFLNNNQDKVLKFYESIGIVSKVINGYYYPFSNQATSIVNALFTTATNLGVIFKYEEKVIDIEKKNKFIIKTEKNIYEADKLILTTGSKAAANTGSDGSGYFLAQKLGHSIVEVLPSLVSLKGKDNFYKDWDGARCEVDLTLKENNQILKEEHGEVQLTSYGISGICVFNLSGIVAKGLNKSYKEEIEINFVPWFKQNDECFKNYLDEAAEKLKDYTLSQILEGFLNYKVVNLILKLAKVARDIKWNQVDKDLIIKYLRHFNFEVLETNDFNLAQVCSGGVALTEVNMKTLESLKVANLYLGGEILDVDGDCGGYNLGFACMCGLVIGESIND